MERTDGGRRQRKNSPLTKGEKWLLCAGLVLVGLFLTYAISSYVLDLEPEVSIPPPAPMPSPNALDYYIQARAQMVLSMTAGSGGTGKTVYVENIRWKISHDGIVLPPSRWPKDLPKLADMQALLAKNAPVFPIVRQALHTEYRNPALRSFNDYNQSQSHELRKILQLLAADGDIKCLGGDIDGGVERYIELYNMGVDIPRGGGIYTANIGMVAQSQARTGLWSFQDRLSGIKAGQVARRLETIIPRQVPPADILQEEKWSRQALLLDIFNSPGWRYPGDHSYTHTATPSERIALLYTSKRTIMRNYTRHLDDAIANAKLPYAARKKGMPEPGDIISRCYAGGAGSFFTQYTRNNAMNALLIASLALHAYEADHGHYPAGLSELVPKYLQNVPIDHFALKGTLRYKRSGNTYTLYSIGPDGIDSGGQACLGRDRQNGKWVVVPKSTGLINRNDTGDIVAGVNLP